MKWRRVEMSKCRKVDKRHLEASGDSNGASHADFSPFRLFDLSDPVDAPDVTRAVMGRLGYMAVSGKVSRRHRLRLWSRRVGLTLVCLLAIGMAMRVHDQSSRARNSRNDNLPSALGNDLQHQQRRFQDAIQIIRHLTPRLPAPAESPLDKNDDDAEPVQDDVLRAAMLPTRWV